MTRSIVCSISAALFFPALVCFGIAAQPDCPIDLDATGIVNADDLQAAITGVEHADPAMDLDRQPGVDFFDLADFTMQLSIAGCRRPEADHVGSYDLWPFISQDNGLIEIVGDKAFVIDSFSFRVLDVSDPEQPELIGMYGTHSRIEGFDVVDGLAYLVTAFEPRLIIVDVTIPEAPELVGSYDTSLFFSGGLKRIEVSNGIAVVGTARGGIFLIDVSDPDSIEPLGSLDLFVNDVFDLEVIGDVAYVVTGFPDGLYIVDLSTLEVPAILGNEQLSFQAQSLEVRGGLAYLASMDGDLEIIDVSAPQALQSLGRYESLGFRTGFERSQSFDFELIGDTVYLPVGNYGLQLFDVSMPTAPKPIAIYPTPGLASDVALAGDTAFVLDEDTRSLQIFDVSDPGPPSLIGMYHSPGNPQDVAVVDGVGYYIEDDVLSILDFAEPASPALLGRLPIQTRNNQAFDIKAVGGRAYVTSDLPDFQIIDIRDPVAPALLGRFPLDEVSFDTEVVSDTAFIASGSGLQILDISTPTAPQLLGTYTALEFAVDVEIVGSLAYVTNITGLSIIDISDTANPALIGSYITGGWAYNIDIADGVAYLTDGRLGLLVIDIADPTNPALIGSLATIGEAWNVTYDNGLAYISGTTSVLERNGFFQIISVHEPASPTLLATFRINRQGGGATTEVTDSHAYFVAYSAGLHVFDVDLCPCTIAE